MKRSVCMLALGILLSSVFLAAVDAWARAGGGGSSGSRGSRSYSAPARPSMSPSPLAPRPAPPTSFQQTPQRSGWMGGIMGGLGGLVLGGLIGSMLFGGLGHGLGGGIGLLEILIVGGLAFFALSYLKRRQSGVTAAPPGYAASGHPGASPQQWRPEPVSRAAAVIDAPAPSDLDRGVEHVRQMDAAFSPRQLTETASDVFFKVQAAWMARDMGSARDLLTAEMYATLQKDCDRLRAERRVNRLENIAVRSVDLTEVWQESGQDFATVHFLANLLDYTTDEAGQVLEGSRVEPVKFEEFWTFSRPVGPHSWRLSAIQQAG